MKLNNREIEGKFKVSNFDMVIKNLVKNKAIKKETYNEENKYYDLFNLLRKFRYVLRIRNIGFYILTIKGPSKTSGIANRFEFEIRIPKFVNVILRVLLRERLSYKKRREYYLCDDCKFYLDSIKELGNFVEIEANGEKKVLLMKKILGIKSKPMKQSYLELLENRG